MEREFEIAVKAARAGGAIVRKYYKGDYEVHEKAPDNPLTVADTEADEAIKRNVGARGLRIILEELMLDLMYQLPQQKEHRELTITKEMVLKKDICESW